MLAGSEERYPLEYVVWRFTRALAWLPLLVLMACGILQPPQATTTPTPTIVSPQSQPEVTSTLQVLESLQVLTPTPLRPIDTPPLPTFTATSPTEPEALILPTELQPTDTLPVPASAATPFADAGTPSNIAGATHSRIPETPTVSAGRLSPAPSKEPPPVAPPSLTSTVIQSAKTESPSGTAGPTQSEVPRAPTSTVSSPTTATAVTSANAETPVPERKNVALLALASASLKSGSARLAIDGDLETVWNSEGYSVQQLTVDLDDFYVVQRLEFVVAQSPPGETRHEIWLGEASGKLTKYGAALNTHTEDREVVVLTIDPAQIIDRVQIRTTKSPSWIAWREVRVFGESLSTSQLETVNLTVTARPQIEWPGIRLVGDIEKPVQVTNARDGSGRLFVVEQTGRIRILKEGDVMTAPFLDISERVSCCHERGLLNVAFPPKYGSKGYFYVNYTNTDGDTVIARYQITANPDIADATSEVIVLVVEQPHEVHNGGRMAFGPKDGYLYIGMGDGGPPGDPEGKSQDPGTLLGKILRIDVESDEVPYAIPASNPFSQSEGSRGEIWALGLRNPWGFAFDRETGDLFIPDVGERQYEEINFQPGDSLGGQNYGWSVMQGLHCFKPSPQCDDTGLTNPIAEYHHSQGCAVTGGAVYRGDEYPRMLGLFFYSDYCSGRIWGLKRVDGEWRSVLLLQSQMQVSSIGEGEDGNLFVVDYNTGAVLKLIDALPEYER